MKLIRSKNLDSLLREIIPIAPGTMGFQIEGILQVRAEVKEWINKYYIARSEIKRRNAKERKWHNG